MFFSQVFIPAFITIHCNEMSKYNVILLPFMMRLHLVFNIVKLIAAPTNSIPG